MQKVYLDNAATTAVDPEVIERMISVLKNDFGNPSSMHGFGRSARNHIEQARKNIAASLGVQASEIIFTSGGTEADNLVLQSCVRDLGVTHIITSRIEHHAVLHTAQEIASKSGIQLSFVRVLPSGGIDYEHLEALLRSDTKKKLVSLMHINNEIGTITDIGRVGDLCKKYDSFFHSDLVQSVGHFKLDLKEINLDFGAVSAHKFHGPKGIGFAYIRKNSGLRPLILGGEQERGHRGGTEGVHNIVGMDKALQLAHKNLKEDTQHITSIKNYFSEQLTQKIKGVKFNAISDHTSRTTYTLLNVCLTVSKEMAGLLLFQLDIKGIACSKGSACQSGSATGSHVLAEILSEEDLKKPSIRFSFSKHNTIQEVDYVIEALQEFCKSTIDKKSNV